MNNEKATLPTTVKQPEIEKVENVALENVVGGCGCGCAMPSCNMQMTGRRFGWR